MPILYAVRALERSRDGVTYVVHSARQIEAGGCAASPCTNREQLVMREVSLFEQSIVLLRQRPEFLWRAKQLLLPGVPVA